MARRLLSDEAREAARRAVAAIEASTSAEIVVAARPSSGSYLHIDLLVGFVFAELALLLILFLPQPIRLEVIPFDLILGMALGAFFSSRAPWLRRALSRPRARRARVRAAARDVFFELHVGRTRTRCGVLVYVSLLERLVEVVPDVGVDVEGMGEGWRAALAGLERAIGDSSLDELVDALAGLAAPLAACHPRAADDRNELSDEPHEAGAR